MALGGIAKVTNIKRSLDNYIKTNIEDNEGISVDYEGLKFDDTSVTEWIQPRILDILPQFHRQGSSTQYAETANILFHINIFVKKGSMTASDRPRRIRDIVDYYFRIRKDIDLVGYAEGTDTVLATMRVRRIVTDAAMPETASEKGIQGETQTLLQHAFAVELDYTRLTTKA